jgi:putative membrane protein
MKQLAKFTLGSAFVFAQAMAFAQDGLGPRPQLIGDDLKFVQDAAVGQVCEIRLGKLAKKQSQNPFIMQFGDMMVRDHTKILDDLKALAAQRRVKLNLEPKKKDKQAYEELAKLSGPEFDGSFRAKMMSDHTKDVTMFEDISNGSRDYDVRELATRWLKTIKMHKRAIDEQRFPMEMDDEDGKG